MTKTTNIMLGILVMVLWVVVLHYVFVKNIFQLRPLYAGIGTMLFGFLFCHVLILFWHEHFRKKYPHIRYICHHCSAVFKPTFHQFPPPYMIKHEFNKFMAKCPQCKKKDYMEILKDEPAAQLGEGINK